jgi:beta-lactamase class A
LALRLREPEASTGGSRRRDGQRRALDPRGWFLGLMLFLAFVEAGVVVYLAGGLVEEFVNTGTIAPPAVVGSPQPEAAPGFDAEALQARIEEIVEGRWGAYGVAVLEPASGTRLSLRGDEEFVVASIGKLPGFAALYRAGARGELDLEEEISIRPEDIQGYGTGNLEAFPIGHSLSLRETAYRLVNHSDNTAWAMLDRRLGADKISAELKDIGLEHSRYFDYRSGYLTTPNDVLRLLEKISDPQFTSEGLSREMLDAMTDTSLEDRIPEKLPRDVRVAHKTGSYDENFGDAGVIFYEDAQGVERHYHLVVLAKGASEAEARDVIQNVSLAVYEALTGATLDPGWSRHGELAPIESGVDNPPAPLPSPENTKKPAAESTELTKLPSEEKSSPKGEYNNPAKDIQKPKEDARTTKLPPDKTSSSGSRYNAVPDPYEWEYADPKEFGPASDEESTYWEEEYT